MSTTNTPATVRKAIFASTVGSAIEWFDFMLYGAAAALVFPTLFFPDASPVTGVLLAFTTYFVGFLARPLGAAIFGHIGDRVGRKQSLVITILLMGVGTVGIGLVPPYSSVGAIGPILLVLLRTIQGIGVGGEWGGAVLMAMESGKVGGEGFRGSFPQAASSIGIGSANIAFMIVSFFLTQEQFMAWGWRIPFLFSVVLVVLALWIRSQVPETDAFAKAKSAGNVSRVPVLEVLRDSPAEVGLAALLKSAEMIPVYIFITFVLSYGTSEHGYDRTTLLLLVAFSAFIAAGTMLFAGRLSDRVGHERLYIAGAVAMTVFSFIYFVGIDSGMIVIAGAVMLVSLVPYAFMFAPEPAVISKGFPTRTRYSGASLGFNLAGIIGGGPAPFIATWLVTSYGSMAIAGYIAVFCLIGSLACTSLLHRHRRRAEETLQGESATIPISPRMEDA